MNDALSNCAISLEGLDLDISKLLVNNTDLIVEDHKDWRCPNKGDKVEIVSYDTQMNVQECVRVSKLPYCTVKDIYPQVVGVGNDRYCWAYEIGVEETHLQFLQWHYKLLN
jgi:hypothetical protein